MDLGVMISAAIGSFVGASLALWAEQRKTEKNKAVNFMCPDKMESTPSAQDY